DDLEAIEVEDEDREALVAVAARALDGAAQAVHEERAVRQAGEQVVEGVVDELLLERAVAGDVGHRAREARGLAEPVPHREPAAEHVAPALLAVADAVLALEVRGQALEVGHDLHAQAVAVLGVDAVEPLGGPPADRLLGLPEHLLPARRQIDLAPLEVPVPEAVVRPPRGERVALLAGLERRLRGQPLLERAQGRLDPALLRPLALQPLADLAELAGTRLEQRLGLAKRLLRAHAPDV